MSCCCRVIAPFITLVVLGVLIIVVILSINLHDADLPTFEVYSASINLLTVNTMELTASWNILLSTKNPNHDMRVYYEATSIELLKAQSS